MDRVSLRRIMLLGSLALAVREFHGTPAVFAYGPFFGYFPGVLYDEMIARGETGVRAGRVVVSHRRPSHDAP